MIQAESWLTPRDNSGARAVECIRALGGFHRAFAAPGDRLVVSVKRLRRTGARKVQLGEVHLALLARARFPTRFLDGTSSRAENNSVLLRNRKGRLLGTRIFGWLSRSLRRKKFTRLLLLGGRHTLLLMHNTVITYQINRLSEHRRYNAALHQVALFPIPSAHQVAATQEASSAFQSATLSFRFGSVNYAKGRVLPFFRALELITGQKGVAILSRRAVPARKVRKGGLVGCRVTLRRRALASVLETLGLSLPQIERFTPPRWTARLRTGVANPLERSSRAIRAFRFGELVAIPPLEIGLGLHPDVQNVYLSVRPQRRFREDAYFLLRTAKLPIL